MADALRDSRVLVILCPGLIGAGSPCSETSRSVSNIKIALQEDPIFILCIKTSILSLSVVIFTVLIISWLWGQSEGTARAG